MQHLPPASRSILFVMVICVLSSCVAHKDLINFPEVEFQYGQPQAIHNYMTNQIQSDDVLDIKVYSANLDAVRPFNPSLQAGATGGGVNQQNLNGNQIERVLFGYRVDPAGHINFPLLGRLHVAGLTVDSTRQIIAAGLKAYLKDAVVDIQFINYRVTVLGEVRRPGAFNMPIDRVSIFDVLGQAGDLTDYANRTDILVIRETNGVREFGRLNLQDKNVFMSPYFYLVQNDVVYVEPIKARTATVADPASRALTYVSAGLSILTLVLTLALNI